MKKGPHTVTLHRFHISSTWWWFKNSSCNTPFCPMSNQCFWLHFLTNPFYDHKTPYGRASGEELPSSLKASNGGFQEIFQISHLHKPSPSQMSWNCFHHILAHTKSSWKGIETSWWSEKTHRFSDYIARLCLLRSSLLSFDNITCPWSYK